MNTLSSRTTGTSTILICMLANNATLGLAYGSFGALLIANEQAFGATRETISFGMSALAATLGLTALFMGDLVRRMTPRTAIAIGLASAACAFVGLGLTNSLGVALALWALLGFGTALAAILGPVEIAAEFYPARAGKMLGLINLPVILFVGPWAVTEALLVLGRQGAYLAMAVLMLPIIGLALKLPVNGNRGGARAAAHSSTPAGAIFGRVDFWLITLGIAIIAGTGTAYVAHAIPFAQSRGLGVSTSALMMSVYSGAGLLGVPLFGWLADQIGAPRALALTAAVQCLCWGGLAMAPIDSFLFLSAALGAATTPLTTLHGAAMAQLFGTRGVGKAMGYSYAIKLPFLFSASPAVGYAYVQMADYRQAFLVVAACLFGAVALLLAGSIARGLNAAKIVPA